MLEALPAPPAASVGLSLERSCSWAVEFLTLVGSAGNAGIVNQQKPGDCLPSLSPGQHALRSRQRMARIRNAGHAARVAANHADLVSGTTVQQKQRGGEWRGLVSGTTCSESSTSCG